MRTAGRDVIRVLHVDDDPAFLELAATFLERVDEGLVVETEPSAASALERLAGPERIDCVVSDYDMPGMDGLQFLEAVRADDPDLPFVLFTGKGSEEIASDAISAGVTDYVQKEAGTDQYAVLANRVVNAVAANRSETTLRRTEQRYATLVDSSPAPIIVYDSRARVVRANEAAARFVGVDDPTDLVGEDVVDLVHPEEREAARQGVDAVLEAGEHVTGVQRRFLGADGAVRHAMLVAAPVPFGREVAGQVVIQDVTAYTERQAEQAATSSLLSTLVEHVPVGILAEDRDRRVLVTNHQFLDLFGISEDPASLVGADCEAAAHAVKDQFVDPDGFIETTDEAVEARESIDGQEFELVDGRTVERSSTPLVLDGDASGYLWVYHDVTERKRAELRFRSLFENLPDPAIVVELTADDAITRAVNDAFQTVFGYDEADVLGRSINDRIVPEDLQASARRIDAAAHAGETRVEEVQRVTADGELRDFLFRNVLIETVADAPMAHGIYTDITDRKRRERRLDALHEATRRLMATESHAEIAAIASDAAEDILALPLNGIHLYDPGRDALVPVAVSARTVAVVGEPPAIGRGEGIAWRVFETGEPVVHRNVREDEDVLNSETPIRSELFLPLGHHGVFLAGSTVGDDFEATDVALARVLAANVEAALDQADREQALRGREVELERQNDRLEEFANVVSHDLRNPLNVAEGHLELAVERQDLSHLTPVERAHDRMERLIDDLLALARQGRAIGATEPVAAAAVARTAWANVDTGDARLDLETDQSVDADEARLEQLFENLFRNSVEHGSTGGRPGAGDGVEPGGPGVTVRVGTLEDGAGFYVEDDGPGIPEADRDRVLDSGFSTADEGTGFGLAIVSTIVDAHGWTLRVGESTSGGARFEVFTETASDRIPV